MFAILTSILWISAFKTNILSENRKRKVFENLELFHRSRYANSECKIVDISYLFSFLAYQI